MLAIKPNEFNLELNEPEESFSNGFDGLLRADGKKALKTMNTFAVEI